MVDATDAMFYIGDAEYRLTADSEMFDACRICNASNGDPSC